LGQPFLGDVLECFAQDNNIYITRTDDMGKSTLVVIAK